MPRGHRARSAMAPTPGTGPGHFDVDVGGGGVGADQPGEAVQEGPGEGGRVGRLLERQADQPLPQRLQRVGQQFAQTAGRQGQPRPVVWQAGE